MVVVSRITEFYFNKHMNFCIPAKPQPPVQTPAPQIIGKVRVNNHRKKKSLVILVMTPPPTEPPARMSLHDFI